MESVPEDDGAEMMVEAHKGGHQHDSQMQD